MPETKKPMFKMLLETLESQSDETRAMFLADTEQNLLRAYQEGKEARKKRLTIDKNPYPMPSDNELEKYTMYLCWSEGFADIFFSEDNKIFRNN